MGVLSRFSHVQNFIKLTNNKIPHYAKNFKKEYLCIIGINKEFEYFKNKLDKLNDGLFESNISNRIKYNMKRFLRGQEKGKLKEISNLMLPRYDVDNLIFIKVSATLKIAIFSFLRFQHFQIDILESFLLKKNQKKILFLSKDIGGKRFFLVNYLN